MSELFNLFDGNLKPRDFLSYGGIYTQYSKTNGTKIFVDNYIAKTLDRETLNLLLLHEVGHIELNHFDQLENKYKDGLPDDSFHQEIENQADEYVVKQSSVAQYVKAIEAHYRVITGNYAKKLWFKHFSTIKDNKSFLLFSWYTYRVSMFLDYKKRVNFLRSLS